MSAWSTATRKARQKGAVLISVLLLVTVISALAIAIMDDIRFGIRRTANVRLYEQAHQFAHGAELLGRQAIVQSWRLDPGRTTLNEPWAQGPTVFPVVGGVIQGEVSDHSNCFNVNSLVEPDGNGRYVSNEETRTQYRNLLHALSFGEGDIESLTYSLVDWVDSDTAPSPRGAEDSFYMAMTPPYRTANTLIGHETELRSVRGYTESVYQRVKPYICALPVAAPSQLNVNTLTSIQAPLLMMLTGPELDTAAARQVIRDRPDNGYRSIAEFWSHRSFAGLGVPVSIREQVSLRTRYFAVSGRVSLQQALVSFESILEQKPSGEIIRIARRYGAFL